MTSKQKISRINRMMVLEAKGQKLKSALDAVESEWLELREGELLESDEYRRRCELQGVERHYTWGDVLC